MRTYRKTINGVAEVTEVKKTDTFILYGEIYCVMAINKFTHKHIDQNTSEEYFVKHEDCICENVLDDSDVINWQQSELVHLFNNTAAYAA